MLIKWTFALSDKNFAVDVRDEKEDQRIQDCVDNEMPLILIPLIGKDVYINLKCCEAIIREEVNEETIVTPVVAPEEIVSV